MDYGTLLLLYGCFLVFPEGRAFRHDITVLTNQCLHMVQKFRRKNNVDRKSNLKCVYVCINECMRVHMQWKKEVSGNSGKDLHAASHQIEVFHLNWQQNVCHHDME